MANWKSLGLSSLLALATLICTASKAEDIDLFMGNKSADTAKSNVLFVFDTGANFGSNASEACYVNASTQQARALRSSDAIPSGFVKTSASGTNGTSASVQQCAMYSVVSGLTSDQIANLRIGIMGFNGGGQGISSYDPSTNIWTKCPAGDGGCLLIPLTDLSDATRRSRLLSWIQNIELSGNGDNNIKTGNSGYTGAAMQEAWAYLAGKQGLSTKSYSPAIISANSCNAKTYVIYLANAYSSNGTPKDQNSGPELTLKGTSATLAQRAAPQALTSDYATAQGTVSTACGAYTFDSSANAVSSGIYSAHWASYLRRQGVTSYGIGVIDPSACKPDYPAQLSLLASKGGGKYFSATNFDQLKASISSILDEILAVNAVFASASLPVSVNTQGTYLNQVFVGMFRPDPNKLPRWAGNLKQYKFKAIQSGGKYELKLFDAADNDAINANTGFMTQCARSFWGPPSRPENDYWTDVAGAGRGTCSTLDPTGLSDFPDGDVVEKGGAGYRLRTALTPATRNVKTCTGSCTSLVNFSDTSDLGKWTRGENVQNEKASIGLTAMRPSAHGDVVHSRPVAIDYGGPTGVVVFYGANDGMLRAVNGNQVAKTGNASNPGDELWAFVAPEHLTRLNRIFSNKDPVDVPSKNNVATQKPYFFDGPVTGHKNGSNVWIFATQRRGGRMIYAFDVSDPAAPAIKWRVGCLDNTTTQCTTGLSGIGQTWSAPRVIRTQAEGSGTPLLILGGGYDTCEDITPSSTRNNNCTSTSATRGKHIYVLNADTGEVVKTFDTLRSVVGDVTIVPNSAGLAQYGYAADTGGNVYRITLTGESNTDWSLQRIAALGLDTVPSSPTDGSARKFMYGPEVMVVTSRGFNAVLLGSGDREHPLAVHTATAAVQNYFYMLMDKPGSSTWLTDVGGTCGADVLCHASLLNIEATSTATVPVDLNGKKGWRMQLASGEQVVTSAVALFGEVTFSTHQPSVASTDTNSTTCANNSLGTARVYNVSYLNAAPPPDQFRGEKVSGGGLPPSPVAGLVTLDKPGGGVMTVPFIIGKKSTSPTDPTLPDRPLSSSKNKERVYWYIKK